MNISASKAGRLREAWFGPLTTGALADLFKLGESTVRKFWACERSGGRLPAHPAPRPYFKDVVSKSVAAAIVETDDDDDDIETMSARDASDALLALLRKHHGRDRVRGVNDEMPFQTLEIERLDKAGNHTPSRSRVRDFQRGRDAYVGAALSKKDK